jgi:hypothetical protein
LDQILSATMTMLGELACMIALPNTLEVLAWEVRHAVILQLGGSGAVIVA